MTAARHEPRRLTARELDADRFSTEQRDALFAAVLVDDEVDAHTRLPEAICFDFPQEQLLACFDICRQLWKAGFDAEMLIGLSAALWRDQDLSPDDRLHFKHVRAKFKHFRYAHALYGEEHRYPALLNLVTTIMGGLQDAFRNGHRIATRRQAALFRLLLSHPFQRQLHREADRLMLASGASFRRLLEGDVVTLEAVLAREGVTGHQFHDARKVIGRQVSFWDTLRTIEPSEDRYNMSRSMSAINGLMGAFHDGLIERKIIDRATYRESSALPEPIADRLRALVGAYRANGY